VLIFLNGFTIKVNGVRSSWEILVKNCNFNSVIFFSTTTLCFSRITVNATRRIPSRIINVKMKYPKYAQVLRLQGVFITMGILFSREPIKLALLTAFTRKTYSPGGILI